MQKEQGFIDGYEVADKEFQHFKLTYGKEGGDWLLGIAGHLLQKGWWDYGYKKERVVLWTLGFLLLFTLINATMLEYLNEQVYAIDNVYSSISKKSKPLSVVSDASTATAGVKSARFSRLIDSLLLYFTGIFWLTTKRGENSIPTPLGCVVLNYSVYARSSLPGVSSQLYHLVIDRYELQTVAD